jgi:hypothetical protein
MKRESSFIPANRDLEYGDVKQWAIRLEDGKIFGSAYDPSHRLGQPGKEMSLIERTPDKGIQPEDKMDEA